MKSDAAATFYGCTAIVTNTRACGSQIILSTRINFRHARKIRTRTSDYEIMLINLLYHDVTPAGSENSSGFPGPAAARYKLTPEEFDRHLDRIATVTNEPPFISVSTEKNSGGGPLAWTISFDDGGTSALTEIAEKLEKRGWRGWFFIPTDFIGAPSFCSREQVLELHRRGHVIGSHSCSHPERISSCSWDVLIDEWTRSCQVLAEIIGEPVTSASVPGGFYSEQVAQAAAKAGIRVLFNSEPTTASFKVDQMLVFGRYNIYRGMSADDAGSLVTSALRRWRQTAFWNLKKVAKVFIGPLYKSVRQRILARGMSE